MTSKPPRDPGDRAGKKRGHLSLVPTSEESTDASSDGDVVDLFPDPADPAPDEPWLQIAGIDEPDEDPDDDPDSEIEDEVDEKTARRRRNTERKILRREKALQAVQMHLAGSTYQQIADKVGYCDRQAARKAVQRELEKMPRQTVENGRTVARERYNYMLAMLWSEIEQGNLAAIDRALKVQDALNKLDGLNEPEQLEVTGHTEATVVAIDASTPSVEVVKALQALAGFTPPAITATQEASRVLEPSAASEIVQGEIVD